MCKYATDSDANYIRVLERLENLVIGIREAVRLEIPVIPSRAEILTSEELEEIRERRLTVLNKR
jgi:hypothetical protein